MFSRIYSKLNLYRRRWLWASAAFLLLLALAAAASSYQRRGAHKLRATALVELTTDASGTVSTRVIPITILADGSFRDASIYESRPRPMALGNGVVYEVQKTGIPMGYVTISNGSNTLQGWVGQGKWQPVNQVQAKATPKPEAAATPADERPVLHREGETTQPTPSPTPAQTQPGSGDDRPVLHRGGSDSNPPNSPPTNQPASQPTPQTQTQPDAEPAPDPDRPVLRRRTSSSANEAPVRLPVPSSTPAATPTPSQTVTTPPLPVTTPGTQTLVGVSDAQSSETRSYEFHWKPEEKTQIEAKMRKLALAQLPGESAQANEHVLTNVVIRSFDLDLSNDAVVVITAEVPGGYLAPAGKAARGSTTAKTGGDKFVSRYVTVIARVDIDGNPQKLAASVTDSSRLDVAPRLELIDAVDVDGDGLAELLFREYDFDQKSFIVYGVGHGTVNKVFEGASQPIK